MTGLRQVIIPTRADMIERIQEICDSIDWHTAPQIVVIEGGEERVESVNEGLAHLDDQVNYVAVHDAVRPLIKPDHINQVLHEAVASGGAIPATPCRDTLKKVSAGKIQTTVDRSALWNAQTPQCFRRNLLEDGYRWYNESGGTVTDDAGLLESECDISVVEGSSYNIKLTYPEDVSVAELILGYNQQQA